MIDTDTYGFSWVCTPESEDDPCTPVFQHCDDCDGTDESCEMCNGWGGGFCCHHDLPTEKTE